MGTVEGDIEIETLGAPFPHPVGNVITICGKQYAICRKEEVFDPTPDRKYFTTKYICYLKEFEHFIPETAPRP